MLSTSTAKNRSLPHNSTDSPSKWRSVYGMYTKMI
jgi:hypothetical protein